MENRKLKNSELERKSVEEFKEAQKTPIIVILDNIRSLNNIGSVFRTADAFLIQKIYLCGITAKPPHKDIQKTALGATETVDWKYTENTLEVIRKLQEDRVKVFSVEQAEGAVMLNDFQPEKGETCAVVFGNEVKGVQQEVVSASDGIIEIPQLGSKHSLNIAVSTGVILWDLFVKISSHTSRNSYFSH
ncbi:RNA methyltransferase [Autumnicola musiva]|uniref:RNA methyltransferase n=1 Tax=Autumnicola musiva TaxID=3075589 RepID=A0ABU3D2N8_9FLAO|nr:RNA methyltransferase [Zunongwangia sp. F117]MDT0675620.1 RNA methyltransferase [Zunongwangia sp. F117]